VPGIITTIGPEQTETTVDPSEDAEGTADAQARIDPDGTIAYTATAFGFAGSSGLAGLVLSHALLDFDLRWESLHSRRSVILPPDPTRTQVRPDSRQRQRTHGIVRDLDGAEARDGRRPDVDRTQTDLRRAKPAFAFRTRIERAATSH
jgi:hypothetical protein